MKYLIPLCFAVLAIQAGAWPGHRAPVPEAPIQVTHFEERVRLAKEAESDDRFKTYRPAMLRRSGRYLARAMRSCIAGSPKPEQKAFVLVADIDAEGKATAVEVNPDNAVARCYAARFSAGAYPRPPAYSERPGFPVAMKIRVVH